MRLPSNCQGSASRFLALVLPDTLDRASVRSVRIVYGQRPREINSRCLTRKIQVSQQAPFARQGVYTIQKPLQPVEVGIAFRRNQFLFPFLACVVPFLRDPRRVPRCVCSMDPEKSCLLHEPFIRSRRTVEVQADRAACRNFLGGNHSANHESVAEQHPTPWLQYAKHLNQYIEPPRNMAQTAVEKSASKGPPAKGRFFETSHCSKRAREPRAVLCASSFALRIPGSLISSPTIWQPSFSARCKAYPPEPQPISNTKESRFRVSSCGISWASSVVTQLVWPKSWP